MSIENLPKSQASLSHDDSASASNASKSVLRDMAPGLMANRATSSDASSTPIGPQKANAHEKHAYQQTARHLVAPPEYDGK